MLDDKNTIPRPEFPTPDWQRKEWLNLNGTWKFSFDIEDKGVKEEWSKEGAGAYSDRIVVPFSWASPLSGIGKNTKGIGWYNRKVAWKPAVEDSRIFLHFDAVDYLCEVWVNGSSVGKHQGGYGAFAFDVTDVWRTEGENEITVRVQDEDLPYQTRGKQGYGEIRGIWQTVWLEARPQNYIKNAKFATKIDGHIELSGTIYANHSGAAVLSLNFDQNKLQSSMKIQLQEGENYFHTTFTVPSPELWSPENPKLYYGTLELEANDEVSAKDQIFTYFGIREIGYKKFEGKEYPWITLNGKPIYLNGTLDQSFNPTGFFTYPSDEEMRNDIWRLKRLGLNFVRIHIKPEEPRKLYWADQLGMLVMEDMPCFWGEPEEQARDAYESEIREVIARDRNHPSIFSWVMFNETWGLFTTTSEGKREYLPETQAWVNSIYEWAKKVDPTRLIEDNSPCNSDHVESDLNTWHFYINGYELLRDHLENMVEKTYPGSTFNYIGGNKQSEVPLMNSECGAVWGIEGSAGDSDIAWHYHYMMNEFRKHDKICGFVFTEFHDVVNEFNGYYRIDNSDKDFGYEGFDKEMSLKDLHSADFLVIDMPPCVTTDLGEKVTVPVLGSSFDAAYHGKELKITWKLWQDVEGEKIICQMGEQVVVWRGYGTSPLVNLELTMPSNDALAVLSVSLVDEKGSVITRNFTTFDVESGECNGVYPVSGSWVSVAPSTYSAANWQYTWNALDGQKVNGGYSGAFEYEIDLNQVEGLEETSSIEILFEAGAKTILGKDKEMVTVKPHDISYMHGAKADPGMNINSYLMTDEKKHPTVVEVFINDTKVETLQIPDDPADSRGVLTWHYQKDCRKLEEAGSYGYLQRVRIPSRIVSEVIAKRGLIVRLSVPEGLLENQGGLALYGRKAGRYPIDIIVHCW